MRGRNLDRVGTKAEKMVARFTPAQERGIREVMESLNLQKTQAVRFLVALGIMEWRTMERKLEKALDTHS